MPVNKGVLAAAAAYTIWGVSPIFFKALHQVPALQIVAHRVIWSFLLLLLVIAFQRKLADFRAALSWRVLKVYLLASSLLLLNWLTYVWAVNAGFVVEASLGYFINPLISVLLGVIFLRERLRPAQWIPVGLATLGVVYLTYQHGSLPWISLVLAGSFGLYALIKKISPLGSLYGLSMETGVLVSLAVAYLLFVQASGAGYFAHTGMATDTLLVLTGAITAIPLLLFASGARRVPLTTIGLLQYIAPTLQFLLGVFVYGEPFSAASLAGFGIIWLALIIFSGETLWNHHQAVAANIAYSPEPGD